MVLVAGPKDHGPGEHDYPAWLKAWGELLAAGDNIEVVTAMNWPAKEEFQKADAMVFFRPRRLGRQARRRRRRLPRTRWRVGVPALGRGRAEGLAGLRASVSAQHGVRARSSATARWTSTSRLAKHPITRNFDKLKLVDESYWQLTGDLPKERVLGWASEDEKPQPLFWSLEQGKGRVFVSIPGHYSWTFDDPLFRVLLLARHRLDREGTRGPIQRLGCGPARTWRSEICLLLEFRFSRCLRLTA